MSKKIMKTFEGYEIYDENARSRIINIEETMSNTALDKNVPNNAVLDGTILKFQRIADDGITIVNSNLFSVDLSTLSNNSGSVSVPATGISLNKTTLIFNSMTTSTLVATVTPSNSTDVVTWKSLNTSVATVSSSGIVTPITNGTCTITATAGNYSATCSITVSISESPTAYTITNNLTNCSGSNSSTSITSGNSYTNKITASSGHTLTGASITVTMGGVDITSSAYSNGTINISSVTGNVVITVSAVASTSSDGWRTASQIVNDITVGWNYANALDATQPTVRSSALNHTSEEGTDYETQWGNPLATQEMMNVVAAKGFNAVRIPVTWNHHLIDDGSGNITISTPFLNRVKTVVDMCINAGMIVMLNSHHDTANYSSGKTMSTAGDTGLTWEMKVPYQLFTTGSSSPTNATMCGYMKKLWTQIANAFKDYDDRLIFEGFNEILDSDRSWAQPTDEEITNVNNLNNAFIQAVRATGGNNAKRVLCCQTYGAYERGTAVTSFSVTDSVADKIILQAHYYTDAKKGVLEDKLATLASMPYPVIIGEMAWGLNTVVNGDTKYYFAQNYISIARSLGIKCFWWDSNNFDASTGKFGLLNRSTLTWERPQTVQGLIDGVTQEPKEESFASTVVPTTSQLFKGIVVTNTDKQSSNYADYELGSLCARESYAPLTITLAINGTDDVNISVHNKAISTPVAVDSDAIRCNRYAWLDENKVAITSIKVESGITEGTLTPPSGAKWLRLTIAAIWNDLSSTDALNYYGTGDITFKITSNSALTVDTSNFDAQPEDESNWAGGIKILTSSNFVSGRIIAANDTEGGTEGEIYQIPSGSWDGGYVTTYFTGIEPEDSIKIVVSTPGYGEGNEVVRICRYSYYDTNDQSTGVTRNSGDAGNWEYNKTFTGGSNKLGITFVDPWRSMDWFTGDKMKEQIDAGNVIIKAYLSSANIKVYGDQGNTQTKQYENGTILTDQETSYGAEGDVADTGSHNCITLTANVSGKSSVTANVSSSDGVKIVRAAFYTNGVFMSGTRTGYWSSPQSFLTLSVPSDATEFKITVAMPTNASYDVAGAYEGDTLTVSFTTSTDSSSSGSESGSSGGSVSDSEEYELVFEDDFSNGIDTTKWNLRDETLYQYRGRKTVNKPENAEVITDSDGTHLQLTGKLVGTSDPAVDGISMDTAYKHVFGYGKMEARVKIPNKNAVGSVFAFWTCGFNAGIVEDIEGENYKLGCTWAETGEIDITEIENSLSTNHKNNYSHSTLHFYDYTTHKDNTVVDMTGASLEMDTGDTNWHIYTMEWDELNLKIYLDGVLKHTVDIGSTEQLRTKFKAFHKYEQYIILDVAAYEYDSPSTADSNYTGWPFTALVDYVKVWQKKGQTYNTTLDNYTVLPKAISVVTQPNKTEYTRGSAFDPTGLTCKIKYSDDSSHTAIVDSSQLTYAWNTYYAGDLDNMQGNASGSNYEGYVIVRYEEEGVRLEKQIHITLTD